MCRDIRAHEALKQLASETKHLGQYCVRLSCGYSRGTKVISKQKHLGKNYVTVVDIHEDRRMSTSQTFLYKIPGLTVFAEIF